MSYVIGFDASTQSCSATLLDAELAKIVEELSVNFGTDLPQYNAPNGYIPDGKDGEVHSNPLMWLDALDLLFEKMVKARWPLSEVVALSGSGQQHGSAYLNANFPEVVGNLTEEQSLVEQLQSTLARRTSPIWMDSSTTTECGEIAEAIGGNDKVCAQSGSIMIERFTGAQIRKFSKQNPEGYADTETIHLVSSFMASVLSGCSAPIDTGDGAGMNLMNLSTQDWDASLVEATAESLADKLPPVAKPNTKVGSVSSYFTYKYGLNQDCEVYVWSGDNPCSLVGMGASIPGQIVISLGTSYTLFAAMEQPHTDPMGYGHVFGNPMGGYMSLICFMNGSLAREKVRETKDVDWSHFGNDYLQQTVAGNDGKIMLPFYDAEITPWLKLSSPVTNGWSLEGENAAVQIRACLEGQMMNMRLHSEWLDCVLDQILITGGGSKSDEICQVIADVFGVKVARMKGAASASLGAAMMAAVGSGITTLKVLEEGLCQIDEASIISPSEQAHEVYNQLMNTYEELLAGVLSRKIT